MLTNGKLIYFVKRKRLRIKVLKFCILKIVCPRSHWLRRHHDYADTCWYTVHSCWLRRQNVGVVTYYIICFGAGAGAGAGATFKFGSTYSSFGVRQENVVFGWLRKTLLYSCEKYWKVMNKSLTNLWAVIVRLHTLRQVKVELEGSEGSSAELNQTSSWM